MIYVKKWGGSSAHFRDYVVASRHSGQKDKLKNEIFLLNIK